MGGNNQVFQRVSLDGTQYRSEVRRLNSETKTAMGEIRRETTDTAMGFRDYSNMVKKQAASASESLKDMGKAFAKNLGRGALAGGAVAGVEALHDTLRDSVRTGLNFGDALAKLASRADLSHQQVKKLRQEFAELGKTGAKLESLPDAVNVLFGATGNMKQSMSVMQPISQVAAMSGMGADEVAKFVSGRLKGEGREINQGNVQSLLQSLVQAQRGGEFNSIQEAMQAMGGFAPGVQSRTHMSDRDLAGILAGSTRAGANKEQGVAAAQALLHMAQSGFAGDAALGGILGVGSFMKNGKFDVSKLSAASANLKKSGLKDQQAIALFGQAGLSESESQGLLAILKNVEKFQAGVKRVNDDQKTLDQAFEESTDSLSHRMDELKNGIVGGVDAIISPLEDVAKQASSGHLMDAAKALPHAIGEAAGQAAAHPALSVGALLTTAAGGAIMKKMGLFGEAGGLAKGVATGKALQQMGVTPVYVTNAKDIAGASGSAAGDYMKKMEDMITGGGGAAGKAGGVLGVLGKAGKVAGAAGAVLGAGAVGYEVGSGINDAIDENTQGTTAEGFQGNAVERLIFKLDKLFGGESAKRIMAANVKVEVDSKDPAFRARPKATDHARDSRNI